MEIPVSVIIIYLLVIVFLIAAMWKVFEKSTSTRMGGDHPDLQHVCDA
jgi:hypothetical protein